MDQNFKPGFRIDLHIKDLNNVVDAAKTVDAPIPLTQAVLEMMKILHHDGDGICDHSALLKYYQKLSGEGKPKRKEGTPMKKLALFLALVMIACTCLTGALRRKTSS